MDMHLKQTDLENKAIKDKQLDIDLDLKDLNMRLDELDDFGKHIDDVKLDKDTFYKTVEPMQAWQTQVEMRITQDEEEKRLFGNYVVRFVPVMI